MNRRAFLQLSGIGAIQLLTPQAPARISQDTSGTTPDQEPEKTSTNMTTTTLFLCGDVMTGRGIDQVLPHPSDPRIYEPYMRSAIGYVRIAEEASGRLSRPVDFSYVWGEALEELDHMAPELKIINLETAVTRSNDYWPGKGIHYRMHPDNVPMITAAGIECCVLANNHVLDWGYAGLAETLNTLARAGVTSVGAGLSLEQAQSPAVFDLPGSGRIIVFAYGSISSGIPKRWAAAASEPGVNLLNDLSEEAIQAIADAVGEIKRRGDVVVFSIHWGGNWGYEIPSEHRRFAHKLIDTAGVDVIHGHSSHHPKGIEVYNGRPIIYGCGDFINDYEGISGYEQFRGDLSLMYFLTVDRDSGRLRRLVMTPTQMKRFRVNRATERDTQWLRERLAREGTRFGTHVVVDDNKRLSLSWT